MTEENQISEEDQRLLEGYCLETLSDDEFQQFQTRLKQSPLLRKEARHYLAMDAYLREKTQKNSQLNHIWQNADGESQTQLQLSDSEPKAEAASAPSNAPMGLRFWLPLTAAAAISFLAGTLTMYSIKPEAKSPAADVENVSLSPIRSDPLSPLNNTKLPAEFKEQAVGFAVINGMTNVKWMNEDRAFIDGDAIGADKISIKSGTVNLDFFSGASIVMEGPAELDIQSAWAAYCHRGKLRAEVPPAAKGFTIFTLETKVVDMGTSFGLSVTEKGSTVMVYDGEVEVTSKAQTLRLTNGEGMVVTKESQKELTGQEASDFKMNAPESPANQPISKELRDRFQRWQKQKVRWSNDDRLIAYYSMDENKFVGQGVIRNISKNPHLPGYKPWALVGKRIRADLTQGRWGALETYGAIDFKKPGARVRVRIPGTFKAYSFAAWVRIDALDKDWNSLFMGDSYQIGEPHWQIHKDGTLIICVRKLDRPKDYHRLYFSPKIWDPSQSGQWMHLATVYDPINQSVSHYKNGKMISKEAILDEWVVPELKIGPAEIGNWGLPTRKEPVFALRNLNGRMDELMIFKAPLTAADVSKIYHAGSQ